MKKLLLIGFIALAFSGCENKKGAFIETIETENDMATAISKFKAALPAQGLTLINTIDHSQNAKNAGLRLEPETVLLFGNPNIDTKLMKCNPSMGLDLPLRILFTTDYEGKATIMYTNPEYWSLKHNIKDKSCLNILQQARTAMQELAKAAAAK